MGAGRFMCVAVPFGLTVASLVCILIAMLSGITNKNLDMFDVNTANLSISSSSLQNLVNLAKRDDSGLGHLTTAALGGAVSSGSNITAKELGLADHYKVNMWNYCYQTGTNTTCTKAKFNWAASALNITAIETLASSTSGVNVTLPKEMTTALKTFTAISKWTEVVYIIALITCVLELVLGLFAICSRAGSCVTWVISGLSTTTIIAASIMATAQSSIVVAALKSVAKSYGVKSSLNTSFLAVTWLAVAFSIASGLFWMFTICCCASDHKSSKGGNRRSRGVDDNEKLIPTGHYAPLHDPNTAYMGGAQQTGVYNAPQNPYHKPTHAGNAYEPYSHTAI